MKFLVKLLPPVQWKFPELILMGIFAGLFLFLIYTSKAYSYLSDNPETCVNCHVMISQYASWDHGSHRRYANCNDCHIPQNNVFNKYFFKVRDGIRHSWMFSLRREPQVIYIHKTDKGTVQQNCIRCHSPLLFNPKLVSLTGNQNVHAADRACWECHRDVPHRLVNSLSSAPNALVPVPKSMVSFWFKSENSEDINKK
jgi:cytochrome c nitrite reductase small subunit